MDIKNLFTYWANQAFSPGTAMKEKYSAFQALLEQDKQAHELMAELEEIYHQQARVDFSHIENRYNVLARRVRGIVASLNRMHPSRYVELDEFYRKIDGYARHVFSGSPDTAQSPHCLGLSEISASHLPLVGEKALNLALLGRRFRLPTPAGFVITTGAFFRFIDHNRLKPPIEEALSGVDIHDIDGLNRRSHELMQMVQGATLPPDVAARIEAAYTSVFTDEEVSGKVAVRSSAVGEDSEASFAGQYQTVLNVGRTALAHAYKAVVASKYSPEALVYRINYGMTDFETPMAVLVVEMIDAMASGVMYTRDLGGGSDDLLEVHAVLGLGEMLVQGEVTPDRFRVCKTEPPEIIEKRAGAKTKRLTVDQQGETRTEILSGGQQTRFSVDDAAVTTLAQWGLQLEADADGPRDVEWCQDRQGQLFLLQSRPLKTGDQDAPELECRFEAISEPVLLDGADRAASGVAAGPVFVALNEAELGKLPDGAVLVTRTASAHYVQVMEKVCAVVSETGSPAGHFASVAREFGIPLVVNAEDATRRLQSGDTVTVYADKGLVYRGAVASLLTNPCIRKRPIADSPFTRKLGYIMEFVSPLKLVDPQAEDFTPGGCRSLHDIIRFAHEAGTREMFSIGDRAFGKSRGARKLKADIPMLIYLMDVGNGLAGDTTDGKSVVPEEIRCEPFLAVWQGLNHPGIQWGDFSHFNWAEYDRIVMSGGIISAESAQLASYAVLSDAYLNLNLKFGYHFVILDTLCGANADENHILFRFNGGGGDDQGRSLRAEFLYAVLQRLEFDVKRTSDLVDARFAGAGQAEVMDKLDQLGRLLGATRLMDMYLDEADQVAPYVEAFFNGRYHFASVEMD